MTDLFPDVMNAEQYAAWIKANTKKKHKYNAKSVEDDGIKFDSKAEHARYRDLRLMERAGEIEDLRTHPVYVLIDAFIYNGHKIQKTVYEADFTYKQAGRQVVEDVKGVRTAVFNLKLKLFMLRYPDLEFRMIN